MTLHPVKRVARPAYPSRPELDAQPELLRLLPRRWRTNAVVLAVCTATGLLAGCRQSVAAEDEPRLAGVPVPPPVARVAPLFQYQEPPQGRLMGKIAIPKFLTEEDARKVIEEEAKTAGLTFTAEARTIKDMSFPAVKDGEKFVKKASIALDGTTTEKGISYEFVSMEDYRAWHEEKKIEWTTRYGMQDTATVLRTGLQQRGEKGTYAVFYDPAHYDLNLSREELKKQVRDFIAWLKAEGII